MRGEGTGGVDGLRALMLTSHPIERSDGADKQLAKAVMAGIDGVEFTWFGRLGRRDPTSTPGRRVPVLSRTGAPRLATRLQIAGIAAVLESRMDLVHAVATVGEGFANYSVLRRRTSMVDHDRVLHTVPAIVDDEHLSRARPLGRTTIALSTHTADLLGRAGFDDVRVVPPGVELDHWTPAPRPSGTPVVLFAGHDGPDAGAVTAIRAVAALPAAGRPQLVLAVRHRAGTRPREMAARLVREASEAGLENVVVHGHVPDVRALVRSATVVLHTPADPGGKADVPLVVLEALASRRPCVVTDHPHHAALHDAVDVRPVDDVEGFAEGVQRLLEDRDAWRAAADRGRSKVEDSFDVRTMQAAYRRIYGEVFAGSR